MSWHVASVEQTLVVGLWGRRCCVVAMLYHTFPSKVAMRRAPISTRSCDSYADRQRETETHRQRDTLLLPTHLRKCVTNATFGGCTLKQTNVLSESDVIITDLRADHNGTR